MNERSYQKRRAGGISTMAMLSLLALTILPALAIARLAQTFDPRLIFGYVIAVSAVTYLLYGHDKRRAESGGWRTPESTLHLVELLGGWPAAFLAQRAFRHKISKIKYQVAFWMIVAFHEATSFDFIREWQYTRAAISLLHE